MDFVPNEHLVIRHIQLFLVPRNQTLRQIKQRERSRHNPGSGFVASELLFSNTFQSDRQDVPIASRSATVIHTLTITVKKADPPTRVYSTETTGNRMVCGWWAH